MKKKLENKPNYLISVTCGTDEYKGEGETALEALQNLEQPTKIFTKGIVTFKHGDVIRTTLLMPSRLKRLWWKSAQPSLSKAFELGIIGV